MQHKASALIRITWFLFIGWWLRPIGFLCSLILMLTIIGFPLGAYAATKTWAVTTLCGSPRTIIIEPREGANSR